MRGGPGAATSPRGERGPAGRGAGAALPGGAGVGGPAVPVRGGLWRPPQPGDPLRAPPLPRAAPSLGEARKEFRPFWGKEGAGRPEGTASWESETGGSGGRRGEPGRERGRRGAARGRSSAGGGSDGGGGAAALGPSGVAELRGRSAAARPETCAAPAVCRAPLPAERRGGKRSVAERPSSKAAPHRAAPGSLGRGAERSGR